MNKETIIQIAVNSNGLIIALTNQGRLFNRIPKIDGDEWEELNVPILNK